MEKISTVDHTTFEEEKNIEKSKKKLKKMLSVEARNKALDSLADAPVGSGIILSVYGFAATMKAEKEAAEKGAKAAANPKKAAVVRPLQPLPSRRGQPPLLRPSNPPAASEGCDDEKENDKENTRPFHDAYEGYEMGVEGEEKENKSGGENGDDKSGDGEKENDAAPAAAGAWTMNMISSTASKFRVAGISRKRRLE